MNRLVIVGNGFDLAHGLPTSYRDFIDDFWKNFGAKVATEEYKSLIHARDDYNKYYLEYDLINNFNDFKSNIRKYILDYPSNVFEEGTLIFYTSEFADRDKIFEFKNDFFKRINKKNSENWVDIENEYYSLLKAYAINTSLNRAQKKEKVERLNHEFEEIKILLKKYLVRIFNEQYDCYNIKNKEIQDHLSSIPEHQDFLFNSEQGNFYDNPDNMQFDHTMFLSFNYTKTVLDYSNYLKTLEHSSSCNYIHGEINLNEVPIIFGFGDEMDKNYKEIEDIDDNEYLKNFKSIQYLEHSNYKNLYNFIESQDFQVYIMGHSCGLSDRTLLSTIFENDNCLSVKVFYHKKKDKTDNYTEIVQNISRHFSDKKMLRKKVVEKKHCKPLLLK